MQGRLDESQQKSDNLSARQTAHARRREQSRREPSAAWAGSRLFSSGPRAAYFFDVDGNRYIDYIGSWGPMILGHQHPQGCRRRTRRGRASLQLRAPTQAENELAELIIAAVPSIEMVRLVNSGTEATMIAIRLARGFTGRDRRSSSSPAIITGTSIAC